MTLAAVSHSNVPLFLFSCLVSAFLLLLSSSLRNPAVLHQLQLGTNQPLSAGMMHVCLQVYTFLYVPKFKK